MRIPEHGETTYETNPELYEFKLLLEDVLGMATATPTWRADVINKIRKLQKEAEGFRSLQTELNKLLIQSNRI